MLRVLCSILVASVLSSILYWAIVSVFGAAPVRFPEPTFFWLFSSIAFATISVLGFPWVYVLKKKSITKLWQVTLLGAVMASLPFLLYCVSLGVYAISGVFGGASLGPNAFGDLLSYVGFCAVMGGFCGAVVWLVGIRGNNYFGNQ